MGPATSETIYKTKFYKRKTIASTITYSANIHFLNIINCCTLHVSYNVEKEKKSHVGEVLSLSFAKNGESNFQVEWKVLRKGRKPNMRV